MNSLIRDLLPAEMAGFGRDYLTLLGNYLCLADERTGYV